MSALVDDRMNDVVASVGEDMALATFDPVSGVVAADATALGGFQALAVEHASTRAGRAPFGLAERHQQITVERFPDAAVSRDVIVTLYRGCGRKGRRQHPPRQAAA